MIRTLSYISKININKEKTRILLQQLMKNIKISFIEDKSTIKYEEYYFNGIPIPSNVEFNKIGTNSFNISWKLDDINIINIDKKEIKYKVEIKRENEKEKFKQIYEGEKNECFIDKLNRNTNYEIRLCSFYNNIMSNYTQIYKIKTKNIDSLILNETEKGDEFLNILSEWIGYKEIELLYRGTRDGSDSSTFHNKCDNKGPNICLIKNEKGNIFGGYSSISWSSDGNYHTANGSFLFTLTNIHGTKPTKFPNSQNQNYAVQHLSDYGPIFGNGWDLYIYNNYLNNKNSGTTLGCAYQDILGKGRSVFTGDENNNNGTFKVKELEVFKVK